MSKATSTVERRSFSDLSRAVLGQSLSIDQALGFLMQEEFAPSPAVSSAALWVGSVGYENYRDVDDFARVLADAGVEQLVDVRELPISRKRGFAKTALSEALANAGVEYVHLRALGNPKEFRDLYKSGKVSAGKSAYQRFLLCERSEELADLNRILREKRSALMCVEHDPKVCHRQVILDALRDRLEGGLEVAHIG
jgi:uncharacterized protein (DUF488 family)